MKLSLPLALLLMSLSACSLLPQSTPDRPDGKARLPVNNPQAIAEFTRRHAIVSDTAVLGQASRNPVDISLAQMLEQYIPADYQVFPGPGIQLDRRLNYDRSRNWVDAVPSALAAASMSASIDPVRRAVVIRAR
jgi:hypothetical protein